MIHFITTADSAYLIKALTLIRSFLTRRSAGTFWLFTRNRTADDVLARLDLPELRVVAEPAYLTPALAKAQQERTRLEYACTAKPILLQYVMRTAAADDWVVWLDGDMFFFRPAEEIIAPRDAAVLLSPHRYTPAFQHWESLAGKYNAGFVAFRRSPEGMVALDWWAERCLEWCGAQPRDGLYADQGYLGPLAQRFAKVVETPSFGVNAAPWNSAERSVTKAADSVQIAGHPLILYHFQSLRIIQRHWYDLYADNEVRLPRVLTELVYRPYVQALRRTMKDLRAVWPGYDCGLPTGWRQQLLAPLKRMLMRQGNLVFA